METLANTVWCGVSDRTEALLIANRRSNVHLSWWMPIALVKATWLIMRHRPVVLLGDALVFTVLFPVLVLLKCPHAVMVMGLDVTFENSLYRRAVRGALRRADLVLPISASTGELVGALGVSPSRMAVIRPGLDEEDPVDGERECARAKILSENKLPSAARLIVTVGRLVERKGVAWFIRHVLPHLPPDTYYLVAGDGPHRAAVDAAIDAADLRSRVRLLGEVDQQTKRDVMLACDVFVLPNVPVAGDVEGFGLVAIEAAQLGALVLAADLEGLRDAVIDGETGLRVEPEDATAWTQALEKALSGMTEVVVPDALSARARAEFGSERMVADILSVLPMHGPE